MHLISHNNFLNPPSQHKPHYFLITLGNANHSHSVIHKQKGTHDRACIKALSDEKMHSLPHRSATRITSSTVYTKIDIFTLHTNLLSLPQTHKHTQSIQTSKFMVSYIRFTIIRFLNSHNRTEIIFSNARNNIYIIDLYSENAKQLRLHGDCFTTSCHCISKF